MRLVVETDQTRVVVDGELERLLEHGTLAVRLDAVKELLGKVRTAAAAVTPVDAGIREFNPERMEMLAQTILGVAASAKALADAADPNNSDAVAVKQALHDLNLDS